MKCKVLMVLLLFCGCSDDYGATCSLRAAYPGAEYIPSPGERNEFIIRKQDGSVSIVWYNPASGSLVNEKPLFPAMKCNGE